MSSLVPRTGFRECLTLLKEIFSPPKQQIHLTNFIHCGFDHNFPLVYLMGLKYLV